MRRSTHFIALLFMFAFVVGAFGCSTENIPKKAMPPGATFTGLWYSNYEDMVIEQKGTEVVGTFEYKDGGKIAGRLEGGVLLFDWVQIGDLAVGRREVTGKGYLVMSDDGKELKGRWGYGESRVDGGEWTAEKATEDYSK